MSHEGKMFRGEIFSRTVDVNGNYPEEVINNEAKKADLDYFLEQTKPAVVEKPKKKEKVKEEE